MLHYDTWDPTGLRQLQTFLAVAEARSFSLAAERIFVSQPAVSNQIKGLEKRLGTRLFDRGRRLGLTEAGYALLQRARLARELMEALEDMLSTTKRSHLELGVSSVWEYILPPLMGEFQGQHPDVEMGLRVANSEQIAALVAEREVHLGFVGAVTSVRSLEAIAIAEDELVIITATGHPLAGRVAVDPNALQGCVFIQRERRSATGELFQEYLKKLGIEVQTTMELGSDEAVKAAVRQGYGLAMVSAYSVAHEVESGALGVVALDAPPCVRQIYAIKDPTRKLSALQEAFLMHVSNACAQGLASTRGQWHGNGLLA